MADWTSRLQHHPATGCALVIPRHHRVVLDLVGDIPDRRSTCRTRAFAAKLVAVQWTFSDIGLIAVAVDRAAGQTHREVVGQRQLDAELRFNATVAAIPRHEIAANRATRTNRAERPG